MLLIEPTTDLTMEIYITRTPVSMAAQGSSVRGGGDDKHNVLGIRDYCQEVNYVPYLVADLTSVLYAWGYI